MMTVASAGKTGHDTFLSRVKVRARDARYNSNILCSHAH